MEMTNRRKFLKQAAAGGASAAAGLATAGLFPRRIFGQDQSGSNSVVYRELGSTGCKVSEIGFGAMNMRDVELVRAAIDAGINYIDTANRYMNGVNERVVGQAVRGHRDEIFLTTKVPPSAPKKLMSDMETSLERLGTDHVDLMLLHNLGDTGPVLNEDFMKTFDKARKKGMCRFVGISMHRNQAAILDAAVETEFWEAALVGYNYFSPPEVKPAIERARKAGIAIIAMKNLLNTRTRPRTHLGDIRSDGEKSITSTQALIKWVLDDPNVDTTIPGMTSFEQLAEDVAIMGMKMGFDDRDSLMKFGRRIDSHYCRGVAGCTGCLDQCPNGVEVSELNRCLGYAEGYGDVRLARENYRELPAGSRVDVCADCDECLVKCVNGLDLTENIRRAREMFA